MQLRDRVLSFIPCETWHSAERMDGTLNNRVRSWKFTALASREKELLSEKVKKESLERCECGGETGAVYEGFDSGRRRATWSEPLSSSSYQSLRVHLSLSLTHTLSHTHTCYRIVGFYCCRRREVKGTRPGSVTTGCLNKTWNTYMASFQDGRLDPTTCQHPPTLLTHTLLVVRSGQKAWSGQRLKWAKLTTHRLRFPGGLAAAAVPRSPPPLANTLPVSVVEEVLGRCCPHDYKLQKATTTALRPGVPCVIHSFKCRQLCKYWVGNQNCIWQEI